MKWFHGITWDTPVRDIGWTWVLLAVLIVVTCYLTVRLVQDFRDPDHLSSR